MSDGADGLSTRSHERAVQRAEAELPLKVAIVGFGTVGRSVAKVLSSGIHPSLQLTTICNRGVERKKVDWVPAGVDWTDSIDAVIASDADIVVELMGGLEPAGDLIRRSLQGGQIGRHREQAAHLDARRRAAGARAAAASASCCSRRRSPAAFRSSARSAKGWRAIGCCALPAS